MFSAFLILSKPGKSDLWKTQTPPKPTMYSTQTGPRLVSYRRLNVAPLSFPAINFQSTHGAAFQESQMLTFEGQHPVTFQTWER